MDFDSSDNSDAHFAGAINTQTFKQFQLERLIKEGKVIPASKLAEAKEVAEQQAALFREAIEDEERHRRAALKLSTKTAIQAPLTRVRLEEEWWNQQDGEQN